MIHVREAIVVEGKYDKNTLSQLVDAPIFETGGFSILKDSEQLTLLRRVADKRGLVILTDPDGAGFVIRNYLKGTLPKDKVLHAYVPDISGKEKRKKTAGKEGKLGVEGMTQEILLQALKNAGATINGEAAQQTADPITHTDLFELGLSGGAGSRQKRQKVLSALELPEHMSTAALLDAVNLLYTKDEFVHFCEELL